MFDTFISYRRSGGGAVAARVYDYLRLKGYNPFYDIDKMSSGRFDEQLKANLRSAENYILILSKGALDRCSNDEDWVYREIILAIEYNLNFIVLVEEGFVYPEDLREELQVVKMFQAIEYSEQTISSRLDILSGYIRRAKKQDDTPIYGDSAETRFKIGGEYMSYYEDVEDGRVVMRRAPVVLRNFCGLVTGHTWFGTTQAWSIRARMYGKKRLAGTYFAKSSLDDGIGTFFLNVVDANTLEGFWSGYDNANNTITTGKYVFKRRFKNYSIRHATVSDLPGVIKIADEQLGEGYLTKEILEKTLDKKYSDEMLVAVHNSTGAVIAFSLYRYINQSEAQNIGRGYEFRDMMFSSEIGYVATVATKESFRNYGIGTALVERCISNMRADGINCFISTAWKHAGIINIGSVLENLGFTRELEIPKYWYESSLREGYSCPQCGNPCYCSCVIYTMTK